MDFITYPTLCLGLLLAGLNAQGDDEADQVNPADLALQRFQEAPLEVQQSVVERIEERIEATEHAQLRTLLDQRDQALEEIKPVAGVERAYYDPDVYAAGQGVKRSFVDPLSDEARRKRALYRPGENVPQFYVKVRYDFGSNEVVDLGVELSPLARLQNYWMEGVPPHADVLMAWLQAKFDHNKKFDKLAVHLAHCYCTLDADCFKDITIYDALASEEGLDMPDVDVIPFAIKMMRDRSFKSPIPPGAKRSRLYERIKRDFLPFFQHRSFVEEASYLYLNPSGWLRPEHEGLRKNLLYLVAKEEQDVGKLLKFFKKAKDRAGFMDDTLKLVKKDSRWLSRIDQFTAERNEARWEIQRAVNSVMREEGLLEE